MSSCFRMQVFFLTNLLVCFSIYAKEEFERVSNYPLVYVCDHFLTDEECDYFVDMGRPFLKRSTVVDSNSSGELIDKRRSSLGMFISSESTDFLVKKVHRRIAKVTRIPEENGESMQILYYGIGAEYQPHYDYFDPATLGGLGHYNRGGQRVATFIVYLNTPKKGGETIFPKTGLKIVPEKGKALLFYNVNSKGIVDPMSFHGGAPVLEGEKWIITRWLREKPFY